jgi:predicted RNA polymerase sigma factor
VVRGHLLFEVGRRQEAASCFRAPLICQCSTPERRFLSRKFASATGGGEA